MKWVIRYILKPLWSRPMRNIYFWLLMISIPINNDTANHIYPVKVYYFGTAITISILMAYTFANNLWLMPRYLRNKQYGRYTLLAVSLTFIASVIFMESVRALMTQYPKLSIHHISVFSTPISLKPTVETWFYELWWCFGGLALWLFLMSTAWYMNDYARQQKLLEAIEKKQIETELHFLKNQVNPHFLFNTLNNLYGLALKKSDIAPDAILRLSSILRYMLYESNGERVSFEKEKEIMQAYIQLELLRLPPSQDYTFNITSDKDYLVPPLLWLPVLENIFKHGTKIITDKYFIDFNVHIENNVMTIQSRNNYKPANGEAKQAGGIGLENLRKRLALLYPDRHSIDIATTADTYSINIRTAI
ncbi:MAG: histidine kinase [Bacteroidetes bacterium]|nr:histidine kinase [Bacteroidota bacterium]